MGINSTPSAKIRLGVSACLLGQEARYDGNHKYNEFINLSLARFFEFVPVCPEVGIGLSVPRPPIRLIRAGEEIRAVGVKDAGLDVTEKLNQYIHQVAPNLKDICGYILKKGSPSCGMERVTVYRDGLPLEKTAGLYAAGLMREYPLLPVEEEGRLHDPVLRENFIARVLVYHRWQQLSQAGLAASALVNFHASHKLLIMAHS